MRIDAFISFGLQAKLSLQRRIGPILRGSVGDTFNLAYGIGPYRLEWLRDATEAAKDRGTRYHLPRALRPPPEGIAPSVDGFAGWSTR